MKLFKLNTGEMILTDVEVIEDGSINLKYPAVIVPIPPQHAGGQQNQIGFGKFMPFSDYEKDMILNPNAVVTESDPDKNLSEAYKQWITQLKSQESGIILPGMGGVRMPMKNGKANDFSQLNI
jgi:hypothetical protein